MCGSFFVQACISLNKQSERAADPFHRRVNIDCNSSAIDAVTIGQYFITSNLYNIKLDNTKNKKGEYHESA